MQVDIPIPDYTSLAKRAAALSISLDVAKHAGPIDVAVDSTGLKVFGEGEWKARKHGASKRRMSLEELKELLARTGHTLVGEYVNTRTPVDCRHKCGKVEPMHNKTAFTL